MEDSEWQDERRSLALPGELPHAVGPLPFLIPFGWDVNLGIGCEILHVAILCTLSLCGSPASRSRGPCVAQPLRGARVR